MVKTLQVGVVTSTHGLKGEVKVYPTTDDVNRFKKLKNCILDMGNEQIDLEVESVKFFKQFVILKFKGLDDINMVEKFRQKPILVTRNNAIPLSHNEYFIADLIGLKVYDENEKFVGTFKDCLQTGANDVYIIETENGYELMLPAIKECILSVDLVEGTMKVHILDGLYDL